MSNLGCFCNSLLTPHFFFSQREIHHSTPMRCISGEEITIDSIGCVRKSVLGERADLFEFANDTIELTEAAQMMNPTDGLPVPWRVGELGSWGRGEGVEILALVLFLLGLVAWL